MSSDPSDEPPQCKHKHCAVRFKEDNEADYVAREKNARHLVQEVEKHNATHPKMEEELRRRRSVANVIRSNGKYYCKTCNKCIGKRRRSRSRRRLNSNRKRANRHRKKSLVLRSVSNCSKLNMPIDHAQRRDHNSRPNKHGNWACPKCTKLYHLNCNPGNADSIDILCNRQSKYNTSNSAIDVRSSGHNTICPDSKEPSVSSYHSFGSDNQEPLGRGAKRGEARRDHKR